MRRILSLEDTGDAWIAYAMKVVWEEVVQELHACDPPRYHLLIHRPV